MLPTKEALNRRIVVNDLSCVVCGEGIENILHLFKDCTGLGPLPSLAVGEEGPMLGRWIGLWSLLKLASILHCRYVMEKWTRRISLPS